MESRSRVATWMMFAADVAFIFFYTDALYVLCTSKQERSAAGSIKMVQKVWIFV
jgi:hypothetical protein